MAKWRTVCCAACWGFLLAALGALLIVYRAWLTPEERVLEEVFGVYGLEESLHANDLVYPYAPRKYESPEPSIWLKREYYGTGSRADDGTAGSYRERRNPKYVVKKIDPEFMANGAVDQGKALHFELIRNLEMLEQYRQRYAILVSNPEGDYVNPNHLSSYETFFYLDGVLYKSDVMVTRLRRMEDCPSPMEVGETPLPDARMKLLLGSYSCSEFYSYPAPGELYGDTRSQESQMLCRYGVNQSRFEMTISPGQFVWRTKSPYNPERGFTNYSYINRPNYRVVELDQAFWEKLNAALQENGHVFLPDRGLLDRCQEKFGVIFSDGEGNDWIILYLDGVIYASTQYRQDHSLLRFYPDSDSASSS